MYPSPFLHHLRSLIWSLSVPQIAEALLTLANLTVDETKREELYSSAQMEIRDNIGLDNCDEQMDLGP
jgi:hypothetical protein